MANPYECLEHIAADVAPHVPGQDRIVHVEVQFDQKPPEVRFQSTPYDRKTLYELRLRAPMTVPESLATQVRAIASAYHDLVQPLLEDDLVFLRVSVTSDGKFLMAQSCRKRQPES
jgi:hypothetical protein